jgi:hypothetical protein
MQLEMAAMAPQLWSSVERPTVVATFAVAASWAEPDALWQHCRNSVGIARLLLHERRPAGLLDTACRTAMEYACRAALHVHGHDFDGDLPRALERLAAPPELAWEVSGARDCAQRLAITERVLAFAAHRLRETLPGRSWGY